MSRLATVVVGSLISVSCGEAHVEGVPQGDDVVSSINAALECPPGKQVEFALASESFLTFVSWEEIDPAEAESSGLYQSNEAFLAEHRPSRVWMGFETAPDDPARVREHSTKWALLPESPRVFDVSGCDTAGLSEYMATSMERAGVGRESMASGFERLVKDGFPELRAVWAKDAAPVETTTLGQRLEANFKRWLSLDPAKRQVIGLLDEVPPENLKVVFDVSAQYEFEAGDPGSDELARLYVSSFVPGFGKGYWTPLDRESRDLVFSTVDGQPVQLVATDEKNSILKVLAEVPVEVVAQMRSGLIKPRVVFTLSDGALDTASIVYDKPNG